MKSKEAGAPLLPSAMLGGSAWLGGCTSCGGKPDAEVASVKTAAFRGPIDNRMCRDLVFLVLFLVFILGLCYIAVVCVSTGQPLRLINGVDSFGNLCGDKNAHRVLNNSNSGIDLTTRPFLYVFDPTDDASLQLCVTACPAADVTCAGCETLNCRCKQLPYDLCLDSSDGTYAIHADTDTVDAENGGCPTVVFASDDYLGVKRCIPSTASGFVGNVYAALDQENVLTKIFGDFYQSRWKIFACCGLAVITSLVLIILMRFFAAPVIYGTVFALGGLLTTLTTYLWLQRKEVIERLNREKTLTGGTYDEDEQNYKIFFGLAVTASVLTGVYVLVVVVMWPRIRFVVSIFEEAAKALARMPQAMLVPVLTAIALGMFLALWVTVYLFLATTSEPTADVINRGHVRYVQTEDYQKMWWYYIFGLFWVSEFILACQEVTIAGTVAICICALTATVVCSPVTSSIGRLVRYHLGSVALGSFLIALVRVIRFILAYIESKLKHQTSKVVTVLLKCLACCMCIFEKILKFINRNAYIEIAIFGYSFCTAAKQAFKTLLDNILRIAAVNSLGAFCLFVCKMVVVTGTGLVSYFWLRADKSLHLYGVIVIAIMVFAYFLACAFIGVYSMAIDTIFLCFCEDHSMNDGSPEHPFFASNNLRKFLSSAERRAQRDTEKSYLLAKQQSDAAAAAVAAVGGGGRQQSSAASSQTSFPAVSKT